MKHGIGKMIFKDKGEYYGYWENGKRHGEGIFTYKNQDIYTGWWKYGIKEGKGTYVFNNTGMKFVGDWQNGNFVQGKWIFPNGTYFEGIFENNQPKGKGKWIFPNHNILEGEYIQIIDPDDQGEPAEGEEDEKKVKVKLEWKSSCTIINSAAGVNSIEQ